MQDVTFGVTFFSGACPDLALFAMHKLNHPRLHDEGFNGVDLKSTAPLAGPGTVMPDSISLPRT
jgi:hypothetical protein